jgi:hypothetical protein
MSGSKFVFVGLVLVAVTLAFGNAISSLADCANMEPQKHPTIAWGSNVKCGDPPVQCGQNYAITNNWACDLHSDDYECLTGEVVLVEVHQYTCSPDCDEKPVTEIKGPGPIKHECGNP